jgi:hypothetical protein
MKVQLGRWGERSFESAEALAAWLKAEREFYDDLLNSQYARQSQIFAHYTNCMSSAQGSVNHQQNFSSAFPSIQSAYSNGTPLPPIDTSDAKHIKKLAKSNVDFAARVAVQLNAIGSGSPDYAAAIVAASIRYPLLLGDEGLTWATVGTETFDKAVAATDEITAQRKRQEAEFTVQLDRFSSQFATAAQERQEAMDKQTNRHENDWLNLKKKYADELRLQAPLTFWTTRANTYSKMADKSRCRFVWAGVLTVAIVCGLLAKFWQMFAAKSPSDIPLSMWIVTGTILALGFWTVKQFGRLYFSYEHLARDAEERVTLVQTFVALSQDNEKIVSEADLKFVLASLFRPSEDGLVKDDGLPVALSELFQSSKRA